MTATSQLRKCAMQSTSFFFFLFHASLWHMTWLSISLSFFPFSSKNKFSSDWNLSLDHDALLIQSWSSCCSRRSLYLSALSKSQISKKRENIIASRRRAKKKFAKTLMPCLCQAVHILYNNLHLISALFSCTSFVYCLHRLLSLFLGPLVFLYVYQS